MTFDDDMEYELNNATVQPLDLERLSQTEHQVLVQLLNKLYDH